MNADSKKKVAAETPEPPTAKQGVNWWAKATPIFVAFIAVCALIFSILQARQTNDFNEKQLDATRKHNRLSVTPHLIVSRDLRRGSKSLGFSIESTGIGPAIIQRIIFKVEDSEYDVCKLENWVGLREHLQLDNTKFVDYDLYEKGTFVQANSTLPLFVIRQTCVSADEKKRFMDALEKMELYLEYLSVYGEKFYSGSGILPSPPTSENN